MKNRDPIGVLADDMAITSKYWETVTRTNYSQPEKELMLAVLKDALMTYKKRVHSRNTLFKEAEAWFFNRERERLFAFETVCGVLGLSPGRLRNDLLAWKLTVLADLGGVGQRPSHSRKSNTRQVNVV